MIHFSDPSKIQCKSMGFLPRDTCKLHGSVCLFCYGKGGQSRCGNVVTNLKENFQLWKNNPQAFEDQLTEFFANKPQAFFRWQWNGDIPGVRNNPKDLSFCNMVIRIAQQFKHTSFVIYTKYEFQGDYLRDANLRNLAVRFSARDIDQEVNNKQDVYVSLEKTYSGENVFCCPGACGPCRVCWRVKMDFVVVIPWHGDACMRASLVKYMKGNE